MSFAWWSHYLAGTESSSLAVWPLPFWKAMGLQGHRGVVQREGPRAEKPNKGSRWKSSWQTSLKPWNPTCFPGTSAPRGFLEIALSLCGRRGGFPRSDRGPLAARSHVHSQKCREAERPPSPIISLEMFSERLKHPEKLAPLWPWVFLFRWLEIAEDTGLCQQGHFNKYKHTAAISTV